MTARQDRLFLIPLLLASMLAAGSCRIYGESAGVNLVQNPVFDPDPGNPSAILDWKAWPSTAWKRHEIVSFQGHPESFFYMAGETGGVLEQKGIKVQPGVWHIFSCWYKADLDVDEKTDAFMLLRIYSAPQTRNIQLGSATEWVKFEYPFFSGTNETLVFEAQVCGQGSALIARPEIRLMNAEDQTRSRDIDGDFENSIEGRQPLYLSRHTRQHPARPIMAIDSSAPSGSKVATVAVPRNSAMQLLGPFFLAGPGDTITLTYWAKCNRPGRKLFSALQRAGQPYLRAEKGVVLDEHWRKVTHTTVVPGFGPKYVPGIQSFELYFSSPEEPEDATIHLDNITAEIKHPEAQRAAAPAHKNLIPNSSFEAGFSGWNYAFTRDYMETDFDHAGIAALDSSTSVEGRHSIKMIVPESGALCTDYFAAEADRPYVVSFWARAEAQTNRPPEILGALWHVVWPRAERQTVIKNEWQRYSYTLFPKASKSSRGGIINRELCLEFRFVSPGTYWLDAIQVEPGEKLTDYQPQGEFEIGANRTRLYPFYKKGETPKANIYIRSRAATDKHFELIYVTRDWRGETVQTVTEPALIPAGKTLHKTTPLFEGANGSFTVDFMLRDPTNATLAAKNPVCFIYGIFPEPNPDIKAEESYFGVYSMLGKHNGAITVRGGNMDDVYRLFPMIGAHWDIDGGPFGSWLVVHPAPNVWRWPDRFLDAAERHNIKMVARYPGKLEYFSRPGRYEQWKWMLSDRKSAGSFKSFVASNTAHYYPKMDLFKEFVGKMVEHYGDRIAGYELWSETGGADPEGYVEYAQAAYETAKRVNPEALIIGPGYPCYGVPHGPEENYWIGKVLKLGLYQYLDVFSAHFYEGDGYYGGKELESQVSIHGTREQSFDKRMSYLRNTYGNKPVWDTEFGQWSPSLRDHEHGNPLLKGIMVGLTPRSQAEYYVRWTIMRMAKGVIRFFYQNFLSNGIIPLSYTTHDLTEPDASPMPIAIAYAQAARRLDQARFVRKIELGRTTWVYLFENNRQPLVIYWNYETPTTDQLIVPVESLAVNDLHALVVEDLMGNPIEPAMTDDDLTLPLSKSPVYVMSPSLSGEALLNLFASADLSVGP